MINRKHKKWAGKGRGGQAQQSKPGQDPQWKELTATELPSDCHSRQRAPTHINKHINVIKKKEGKQEKIKTFSGEQSLTQNICPKAQNKKNIGTNQQKQTKTEKKQQIRSKFVTEIFNKL